MKRLLLILLLLVSPACATTVYTPVMLPGMINIRIQSGAPLNDYNVEGDSHRWVIESLTKWAKTQDIDVFFEDLDKVGLYGQTSCQPGCDIVINNTRPINTQASTLLHELAHVIVPDGFRVKAEVLAESVALLAGKRLGLDTTKQSLAYLAQFPALTREEVLVAEEKAIERAVKILVDAANRN
jgi:hypothetical protein